MTKISALSLSRLGFVCSDRADLLYPEFGLGNPVEGSNFFGREVEQRQLWRKLQTSHLLMLAPRRIGKTSLLKKLRDTTTEHDSKTLYCSFAGCQDELACIKTLLKSTESHQQLHQRVNQALTLSLKKLKSIKVAGVAIDLNDDQANQWTTIGEVLTTTLNDCHKNQGQLIICVDELPIFIVKLMNQDDGLTRIKFFLNWFRDLRQTYAQNIKWILAGSIGLDTITKRLGIGDTINDLVPFPLDAFDNTTAKKMLLTLAKEYKLSLSDQVCDYIIEIVGWPIPYYLQVMLDKLLDLKVELSESVTTTDVDQVFETLLTPSYKSYFDYWRQRLTEELGKPTDSYAVHLLNHICRDPKGVSKATLAQALTEKVGNVGDSDEQLMYLLDVLQSDGYLIEHNQRYQFRLAWLREYWRRRVAT